MYMGEGEREERGKVRGEGERGRIGETRVNNSISI